MFSIATAELTMLVRNKLVAACAILIPLAFGALLLFNGDGLAGGGVSTIASLQIVIMIAMGVYVTVTTTLAARRQTLFLKRLRSGSVSDGSIILGLVGPVVLVSVVQIGIILAVLSAVATAPVNALLLVVAVLATEIMFAGFALATAGVTNSPEHAQVTTLPIFFLVVGVTFWVTMTGMAELDWLKRVLPGGALPELVSLAWNGGDLSAVPMLLLPSLAWAALAAFAARAMFRWEPRA